MLFSLFGLCNTEGEISNFFSALTWGALPAQCSCSSYSSKTPNKSNPFRKWKLKEYLFHLVIPHPLICLTCLLQVLDLASAAIVSVNVCLSIGVCTSPIWRWCLPTTALLEKAEINTGTTVLHYCIVTRENDLFPPTSFLMTHTFKNHLIYSPCNCFSSWSHFLFPSQTNQLTKKKFASQSFLFSLW